MQRVKGVASGQNVDRTRPARSFAQQREFGRFTVSAKGYLELCIYRQTARNKSYACHAGASRMCDMRRVEGEEVGRSFGGTHPRAFSACAAPRAGPLDPKLCAPLPLVPGRQRTSRVVIPLSVVRRLRQDEGETKVAAPAPASAGICPGPLGPPLSRIAAADPSRPTPSHATRPRGPAWSRQARRWRIRLHIPYSAYGQGAGPVRIPGRSLQPASASPRRFPHVHPLRSSTSPTPRRGR